MFAPQKCIGCGNCLKVCVRHTVDSDGTYHIDRDTCTGCGKCADVCPSKAPEIAGTKRSAADVLNEVLRDKCFYGNDGGLTLSGGEPLAQPDFSYEPLGPAKRAGITRAMETSGYAPESVIRKLAGVTDIFLFDYKESDGSRLKEYTGADIGIIRNNLGVLNGMDAKVILRCPIIPGYNDREKHFRGIDETAEKFGCITPIEVEPYHSFEKKQSRTVRNEL